MSLNLSCGGAQADTTTFKAEKGMKIYFLFNEVKQLQIVLISLRPGVNGIVYLETLPRHQDLRRCEPQSRPCRENKII